MSARDQVPTLGELSAQDRAAVRRMLDQIMILLVERAGGELTIPVAEIDEIPKGKILGIEVVGDSFVFRVKRVS